MKITKPKKNFFQLAVIQIHQVQSQAKITNYSPSLKMIFETKIGCNGSFHFALNVKKCDLLGCDYRGYQSD